MPQKTTPAKIAFDKKAAALYVGIAKRKAKKTIEFTGLTMLDFDKNQELIGIELVGVPKPKRGKTALLFSTPYIQLKQRGKWAYASRTKSTGVVGIIALTDDNKVILVEQLRIPHNKLVIELPAGLVGDEIQGEDELAAARKELLEETGYSAKRITRFGTPTCSSAGLSDETIQLFIATGLTKTGEGGGVGSENITVHKVPLKRYFPWLMKQQALGKITDSKTLAVPAILNFAKKSKP